MRVCRMPVGVVLFAAAAAWATPARAQDAPKASEPAPPSDVGRIIADHDRALIRDLIAYLKTRADAPDAEQAYLTIFEVAIKNDWFVEYREVATGYLARNSEGAVRPLAEVIVVMAHAQSGQFAAAATAFERLVGGLEGLEQRDFVASFADQLATQALAAGDVVVAKRVHTLMAERFADDPALRQSARAELQRLDLVGKPAPALGGARDLNGRAIRLADLKGKVVLIDFWATYCVPCQTDLPALRAAYETYRDAGFEIVSVSLDDAPELVSEFVRSRDVRWPQLHNATCGADLVGAYFVRKIPSNVLIDRDGRVVRLDVHGDALFKDLAGRLGEQRAAGPERPADRATR